jgi:hypothetical protein
MLAKQGKQAVAVILLDLCHCVDVRCIGTFSGNKFTGSGWQAQACMRT